jgi:hypothetical protein
MSLSTLASRCARLLLKLVQEHLRWQRNMIRFYMWYLTRSHARSHASTLEAAAVSAHSTSLKVQTEQDKRLCTGGVSAEPTSAYWAETPQASDPIKLTVLSVPPLPNPFTPLSLDTLTPKPPPLPNPRPSLSNP